MSEYEHTWVALSEKEKLRHRRSRQCAHAWPESEPFLLSPASTAPDNALPCLPSYLLNLVILVLKKKKNLLEPKMGFLQQKCLSFSWRPTD